MLNDLPLLRILLFWSFMIVYGLKGGTRLSCNVIVTMMYLLR